MNDWKHLTDQEQQKYIERANYLLSKGFVDGDLYRLAKNIYSGEMINTGEVNEQDND